MSIPTLGDSFAQIYVAQIAQGWFAQNTALIRRGRRVGTSSCKVGSGSGANFGIYWRISKTAAFWHNFYFSGCSKIRVRKELTSILGDML